MRTVTILSTTFLFLLLAAAVPSYARQDQPRPKDAPQEQPKPKAAKPAKPKPQQAKPETRAQQQPGQHDRQARDQQMKAQQDQAKQEQKQQQDEAKRQQDATRHQRDDQAKQQKQAQEDQKRQQEAARRAQTEQKQQQDEAKRQQDAARHQQDEQAKQRQTVARQQAPPSAQPEERGHERHVEQRIPEDRFRAHFGREHHFHPGHPVFVEGVPRFRYSGYWFEIVDPWPAQWAYDDDCYIDYVDDGYYLFDPRFPGMRLAVTIVIP